MPLYQLWGGYRDRLQAICIGGYYSDDEADVARQIERYLGLGFARLQVQGRRPVAARRTRDARRLARQAAGDDFVLMVDANQGYTRRRGDRLRPR